MNRFLEILVEGDLRGNGLANRVARDVLDAPALIDDLLDALEYPVPVIRGHAAHAVERISRLRPDLLRARLGRFIDRAAEDPVPAVRWHLAIVLGTRAVPLRQVGRAVSVLLRLLADKSALARGWAVSSLCRHAGRDRVLAEAIAPAVAALRGDPSPSVQSWVSMAMMVLRD